MCRLMLLGEVLVPLQGILVFHVAHSRVEVCPRPQQSPEVRVVEHRMLLGDNRLQSQQQSPVCRHISRRFS